MFDQQTPNLLFWLPGGLIFCSEDLCHRFTPYSSPQKTLMSSQQERPLPKRDTIVQLSLVRCSSSLTQQCWCMPPCWENYQIFSSFAQKTSNIHKTTLSKPSLSPKDATFKTVSRFKGSSAWTVAQFWVRSAVHVLTPIAEDASCPKNAIQGQTEIPTSAVHWATAVLCSTPLL